MSGRTSAAAGSSARDEQPVVLLRVLGGLSVNEVAETTFGVNLIPYTLAHTSLGEAPPGERFNLEIDPIARYLARLVETRGGFAEPSRR